MQKIIVAIRDTKTEHFNTPFFQINQQEAQRTFTSLTNDPATTIGMYPTDYAIFEIGTFDSQTGSVTPTQPPKEILSGLTISAQKPS